MSGYSPDVIVNIIKPCLKLFICQLQNTIKKQKNGNRK